MQLGQGFDACVLLTLRAWLSGHGLATWALSYALEGELWWLCQGCQGLWGRGAGWLPPALTGLPFSSRTLHLLPGCPPHRGVLCQEAAPELSVGNKRLRKQVRKTGAGQRATGELAAVDKQRDARRSPERQVSTSLPGHSHTKPGPDPLFFRLILPTPRGKA